MPIRRLDLGNHSVKAVRTMPATTNAVKPESTTPNAQPRLMGNYRWVVCSLLFFATTINYIDRQILSLLKEILDQQIG